MYTLESLPEALIKDIHGGGWTRLLVSRILEFGTEQVSNLNWRFGYWLNSISVV